jgi:hypothetical protein
MAAKLRVGLIHQGWPAGSYITTRGLERAFLRRDDIAQVARVAATKMDELPHDLDFVFLEGYPGWWGWRKVQRMKCRKYFWWLSTWFGRLDADGLTKTGFDHVFGNSPSGVAELAPRKPCTYMPLAFDRDMLRKAAPVVHYRCEVAYVGVSGHKAGAQHKMILDPACEHDFHLWGKGWDKTLYRKWHKGLLPAEDIPALYSTANLVLGMTERRQAALGMINNRVFEALGCGAMFIADHFPELERLCGDRMLYARGAQDIHRAVELSKQGSSPERERARAAQAWILDEHTYDHRAAHILDIFQAQGRAQA